MNILSYLFILIIFFQTNLFGMKSYSFKKKSPQIQRLIKRNKRNPWREYKNYLQKKERKKKGSLLRNEDGYYPLHDACFEGNIKSVKKHLNKYPEDVNSKNDTGETPLHMAVLAINLELVKLLLKQYGANPDIENNKSQTPLSYAVMFKHFDIALFLKKSGCKKTEFDESFLDYLLISTNLQLEAMKLKSEFTK